jgi:6-phosphogluconate dehydrogenase (decarboxylating)
LNFIMKMNKKEINELAPRYASLSETGKKHFLKMKKNGLSHYLMLKTDQN